MLLNISILILGLILLAVGGEGLIRGSAALAVRLGLTPLVVGLTVVAFGTSAPELVVSISAALSDSEGITLGNVVGSNILNIGLVLGLTALFCPINIKVQVIKSDAPIMVAFTVLVLAIMKIGIISAIHGIIFLVLLVGYITFRVLSARRQKDSDVESEYQEGIPHRSRSILRDIIFLVGGFVLLVLGARMMVASAVDIARFLGISETVIGLTIVALGTSLPEVAASVMAALRHQPDIALGNVIGSNIFNLLCILGTASIIKPLNPSGITGLDMFVMAAFSVALLPLLYTGFRLQRWEGGILLLGYCVYLWFLWP